MPAKKEIKIQTDSDSSVKNKETAESPDKTAKDVEQDGEVLNSEAEKLEKSEDDRQSEDLAKELKSKEKEAQENYDRLLRVSAEFENYKKRASREMEEFRKFSNQSLIKEMLSVVDNLELAMNSTPADKTIDKGLLEGLEMTHREILKVFDKFHVKPIKAQGQPFDPTFHEAVMQEVTDDFPENTVVNEMQKGYLIHDRLLRPSMVVVSKPKTTKNDTNPQKASD